ncbi:MAG: serine/threonine protein kinase [Candidatus Aminicenantes bacterium]|nr:serine/threonine protein kinase [Candidatus Aminicenantes bacterium]
MRCPYCEHENPDNTRYCGQCGRPLLSAPDVGEGNTRTIQATPDPVLTRGATFAGRYEVIEELGKGGMGRVYKVYDTRIKEKIALKLLKAEIASDSETIERFRNEIKLARQISHRHVCRMFDIGEEGFSTFITMELVGGEDLKSFVRRSGHLTEAKAIAIGRQIAEGLAEAHRVGVVHRDLKPQNIMIDREGNVRIMDFGIALSKRTRGLTGTGVVIGTPEYMSPEQVEAKEIDARTDIYSLGIILFEMVTGRVPFEGETALSVAIKQRNDRPPNPQDLNPALSDGMADVILKCLEKAKANRYQTAETMLADFDKVGQGLTPSRGLTRPVGQTPRTTVLPEEITVKLKLRKIAGLALALLLVAGGWLIWKSRVKPKTSPAGPPGGYVQRDSPRDEAGRRAMRISDPAKPQPDENTTAKRVLTYLAPFVTEGVKKLSPKDIQEWEKAMNAVKTQLPAEGPFMEIWGQADAKIQEAKKLHQEGRSLESQKSVSKGESQVRKLMTLVSDRDKADRARTDMEAARKKAEAGGAAKEGGLLYWLAVEKEKDAADAYQKNDFSGARTLYSILKSVYEMSLRASDDVQGISHLRSFVLGLRMGADMFKARETASWLYDRAREGEIQADAAFQRNGYTEAAEYYLLSAFLYDKSREVAEDSSQKTIIGANAAVPDMREPG